MMIIMRGGLLMATAVITWSSWRVCVSIVSVFLLRNSETSYSTSPAKWRTMKTWAEPRGEG